MEDTNNYLIFELPFTPESLVTLMDKYKKCRKYVDELPQSAIKDDLSEIIDRGYDLICEVADEHGIESYEDKVAFFDNRDFSKWEF